MLVKGAHDPGHVDALFLCLQTDRAGDRSLKRQIAPRIMAVAGVKPDRQTEIRNSDMLDLPFRALDQAFGSVLQVGQRVAIGLRGLEILRIGAPQRRVIGEIIRLRQKPRNRRVKLGHFGRRGAGGPITQNGQSRLGFGPL